MLFSFRMKLVADFTRKVFNIISCVPGLWPVAQLYILDMSLTESVRKMKISFNIDARTLKFGMEHPWAH